jgi:hypothetical protein
MTAATVFGAGVVLTEGGLSRPAGLAGGETLLLDSEQNLSPAVVAGHWVAWVEANPWTEPPGADLVLFDMVTATDTRVPVSGAPDIVSDDRHGWLTDGAGPAADLCTVTTPTGEVTGPCVAFTGRSAGTEVIWTYSPAGMRQYESPVRSAPSVAGTTVVWAEASGGGTRIMAQDLSTGGAPEPLFPPAGVKLFPVVSNGEEGAWVAWLDGDTDSLSAALWVRHLGGGPDELVSAAALPAPLDAAGDRLLFTAPAGGDEGGATLMVYDVVRREGGALVTRSAQACPGCGPEEFLRAAISDEVIVHQDAEFVRVPGTRPSWGLVPLIAHDAREITSYTNMATYLTGYEVASWFTDSAQPSASGSRVAWRDAPLSDSESLIRTVHVARQRLFIPFFTLGD